MTEMTLGKALGAGLRQAMRDDEKVVLLGEDRADVAQHLPGLVRDAFRNLAGAGVLGSETGGEQEAARHHPLRVGARRAGRSAGTDGLYAVLLAHPVRSPSRSLTPA